MALKLSELIARHGDNDIQFQNLDQSLVSINLHRKGAHITFGTEQPFSLKGTERLGLVVWLLRDRAVAIVEASQKAPPPGEEPTQNDKLRAALEAQMRITAAHMRKAGYSEQDILDSTEQARAALNGG